MTNLLRLLLSFLLILCLPALPVTAGAESARSLIETGNDAYKQGDYAGSLEKYSKAAEIDPDSAVALFNQGSALYKQGQYGEAFNRFEQAARMAMEIKDTSLEAQSRYNMGNSAFRRAEIFSRENPEKGLEEFKRSSRYFKSAAHLDPGFSDAVHNLEVSRMTARQVEEMLRQQQQQARQQQEAREQIREQLEKLSKEQNAAAEQTREKAGKEQQDRKSGSSGENDQLTGKQDEITEKTRSLQDELAQLNSRPEPQLSDQMAEEHVKKALAKQEAAREKLKENRMEQASGDQQEAAQELEKARQQLEQSRQKEEKQQTTEKKDQDNGQQPVVNGTEENDRERTSREAEQVPSGESPEDIINQELESRKLRRPGSETGYKAVEKDW